jgi:hypothetical protein
MMMLFPLFCVHYYSSTVLDVNYELLVYKRKRCSFDVPAVFCCADEVKVFVCRSKLGAIASHHLIAANGRRGVTTGNLRLASNRIPYGALRRPTAAAATFVLRAE